MDAEEAGTNGWNEILNAAREGSVSATGPDVTIERNRFSEGRICGRAKQILPSLDLFRPAHTPITLRRPASGSCLPALGDQSPALVGKRLKHRGLDLA